VWPRRICHYCHLKLTGEPGRWVANTTIPRACPSSPTHRHEPGGNIWTDPVLVPRWMYWCAAFIVVSDLLGWIIR
jgi:hypothetical protein